MASYWNGSLQVQSYRTSHSTRSTHPPFRMMLRVDECEVNERQMRNVQWSPFGQVLTDYLKGLPSSVLQNWGTVMTQLWCRPGKTVFLALYFVSIGRRNTQELDMTGMWIWSALNTFAMLSSQNPICRSINFLICTVNTDDSRQRSKNTIELRVQQPAPQNAHVLNFA